MKGLVSSEGKILLVVRLLGLLGFVFWDCWILIVDCWLLVVTRRSDIPEASLIS